MDIFERASRGKLRFDSARGELTTENLWDLSLTGKTGGVDLDALARLTNAELRSIAEGSFVNIAPDPRKTTLELKMDILKHVIQSKLDAAAKVEKAKATAERKRKLLEALEQKEAGELTTMTKEQLQAEIVSLGA